MIICICGPTGVGKTKLSVQLAKKYNAIIANADAMQVYKGLDIGTAKVKEEEKENVEHFLFDIVDVKQNYTVYDYQKDIRKLINDNKDRNIILVGGTGLYMKAALYDYRFDDEDENQTYEDKTNEELYQMCLQKDKTLDIHVNNRKRLIRFLNKKTSSNTGNDLIYDNVYFIGLTTSRDYLYERINNRVDVMFASGLEQEVRKFYDLDIRSKALTTGIGYKELYEYFDGNITLEEAKNLIKQKSRRYAKRQYTWYNHQMNVKWFDVDSANFDNTVQEVINYINSENK